MAKNWESMWAGGLDPGQAFDANRVEPAFQKLLDTATDLPRGRAIVPGCGRGYAVAALARKGYDATGVEIAPTAVKAANEHIAKNEKVDGLPCRVKEDDFFKHRGADGQPYDLVYDCTFLCAIPPEWRQDWAAQMAKLLRPGGEIVTLIFPVVDPPFQGGPPHCMSVDLVRKLLLPAGFEELSVTEVPAADLARGMGRAKEFLGRWRRK